jgi:K+-transporting ATPase ATPase C chain
LFACVRVAVVTILICCVGYPTVILAMGRLADPWAAEGSLVFNSQGEVVGSALIGQAFEGERYVHSRPSAVDYNAAASGGSNKAPSSPALASRARSAIASLGGSEEYPVPVDLVTASGSGLDPHITEAAARFQADRVAKARGMAPEQIRRLIDRLAVSPAPALVSTRIVNVLELNLALDGLQVRTVLP